jgi:hypothetical protein
LTLFSATDVGAKSSTGGLPLGVWGSLAVLLSNNGQTTSTTVSAPPPPSNPLKPNATTTVTTTSSNVTPALAVNALATSLGTVTTPTANTPWLLSNAAWRLADSALEILHLNCDQTGLDKDDKHQKYAPWYVQISDLQALENLGYSDYPRGDEVKPYKGNIARARAVYTFGAICEQFGNFPQTPDTTLDLSSDSVE